MPEFTGFMDEILFGFAIIILALLEFDYAHMKKSLEELHIVGYNDKIKMNSIVKKQFWEIFILLLLVVILCLLFSYLFYRSQDLAYICKINFINPLVSEVNTIESGFSDSIASYLPFTFSVNILILIYPIYIIGLFILFYFLKRKKYFYFEGRVEK
jgi:hypothetical protein